MDADEPLLMNIQLLFTYTSVASKMEMGNSSIPWPIRGQTQRYPVLKLLKAHAMKTCGGSAGMAPLFLTLTEDGVASFRHLLLYPMGKEPQIRKTGD
jgi:hypothetical protein